MAKEQTYTVCVEDNTVPGIMEELSLDEALSNYDKFTRQQGNPRDICE